MVRLGIRSSTNFAKKASALKRIKAEIETRWSLALDGDGSFSPELFRSQNPDIEGTPKEWFASQTAKAKKLQREIDDYTRRRIKAEP